MAAIDAGHGARARGQELRDGAVARAGVEHVPEVQERIKTALRRARIDLWPYIRFRTESEQHELESGLLE